VRREGIAVPAVANRQVPRYNAKSARSTWERAGWLALRVVFGVLLLWVLWFAVQESSLPNIGPSGTYGDQTLYMEAARRWLAGGPFYHPYQLAGPYVVEKFEIMYPPTILPLLVAFAFLPDFLWWTIPLAILVGVVLYWRPSLVGWTLILACLAPPITLTIYMWGNPGIWIVAFLALGTVYGWPAVFVLLKFPLAPFALIGIRRRSWWVAAGVLAVVSLMFLPLWGDYVTVLLNARGPLVGLTYSLPSVPLMLIPLIARWASTR